MWYIFLFKQKTAYEMRISDWSSDVCSSDLVVAEIRATDRAGLLAVLTRVFERAGVDIAWAKVTTLGSSVVDTFGIVLPADDGTVRQELERQLFAEIGRASCRERVCQYV